jgi:hypothetical protein
MKACRFLAAAPLMAAAAVALAQPIPPPDAIAQQLTAGALRADVSFLASGMLEGRGTPSRGLDVAAEYIAAQFRRAGLEPAGDDGYFQTAQYVSISSKSDGAELVLEYGGNARKPDFAIVQPASVDLSHAAALKLTSENVAELKDQLRGKVVLLEGPDAASAAEYNRLWSLAENSGAALIIRADREPRRGTPQPQLRDASAPLRTPELRIFDNGVRESLAAAKAGPLELTVTAHLPEPSVTPLTLRNVIGRLRGSDPALKDSYVILSAHYDHLGIRADRIYNGANDNASGTATVIEIAQVLASLPERPKRSILFMAFFGEERGLLGSRYYVSHPVVPLAATVADLNLEQMGRTDSSEGPKLLQFNATGYDYSTIPKAFGEVAEQAGVHVVKDEANSDDYFSASDNLPFAEAGVPSTTFSVTYEFPDYHMPGDQWPKLDYDNMAKVDRGVASGVWMLAEDPQKPEWNADNPRTEGYIRAREASSRNQ